MKPSHSIRIPHVQGTQRGMSLIEVLIAVLILGIGMLGIAAMQAAALRNSQSSMQQSQAVIEANAMMDAMRANPTVASNATTGTYGYDMAKTCAAPAKGATLVSSDQNWWITNLQSSIGPSACGTIDCKDTAPICVVTVTWTDNLGGTTPPVVIASQL